ncbi:MAG: DUF1858 domain-containing protein [archaeon]
MAAITKKDTIGKVMNDYPEIGSVLMSAGLHCIGCHVSEYESIEDGCRGHGLDDKNVDELIIAANKMVEIFDKLPSVAFAPGAIEELQARLLNSKGKFIRVLPVFGEFDFETTQKREKDDVEVHVEAKDKKKFIVLIEPKTARLLKGIRIDYDKKAKDFVAKSERKLSL